MASPRPGSGQIRRSIRPRSGDINGITVPLQNHSLEALLPERPSSSNLRKFQVQSEPRSSPLSTKRNNHNIKQNDEKRKSNVVNSSKIMNTGDAMGEALENARALREAQVSCV